MTAYEDHSIFQGWTQYYDENGVEWRRANNEYCTNFFQDNGSVFVYQGRLTRNVEKMDIAEGLDEEEFNMLILVGQDILRVRSCHFDFVEIEEMVRA